MQPPWAPFPSLIRLDSALRYLDQLSLSASFYFSAQTKEPEAEPVSKISSFAEGVGRGSGRNPTNIYVLFCLCCKYSLPPKNRYHLESQRAAPYLA